MDRFVSTYAVRLDAKGRISVPAAFRALIARDGLEQLWCHPCLDRPALDAGGAALMAGIDALIARYPPYSPSRDEFAGALYGAIEALKIDPEGRVSLTEGLKTHAGIATEAVLVGQGTHFRIWEPGAYRAHRAEANAKVRELVASLGNPEAAGAARREREG